MTWGRRLMQGVTLIELMVVLAVIGVLGMVAAPGVSDMVLGSRLSATANEFVASATLARSEAVKRNHPVHLCAAAANSSSCATSGGWEQGWIVVDLQPATPVVLRRQPALTAGYVFKNAATTDITFQSTGLPNGNLTMELCKTSSATKPKRSITITATGQASIGKPPYPAGTCTG